MPSNNSVWTAGRNNVVSLVFMCPRQHRPASGCMAKPPELLPTYPRRMYAFDVHCNSYFPLFLLLYGALCGCLLVARLPWRPKGQLALKSCITCSP